MHHKHTSQSVTKLEGGKHTLSREEPERQDDARERREEEEEEEEDKREEKDEQRESSRLCTCTKNFCF